MEAENKDWKPEVGGKAWIVSLSDNGYVIVEGTVKSTSTGSNGYCHVDSVYFGHSHCHPKTIFPTHEAALASIKIYDLEGKEVLIPRADAFLAEKVLGLQMENGLLKKPVTTLAQAQMLLYEHGMILDLSGLSPILIERGRAAIGGKSDQREGGC